jgi:ketosteroid isomerase-like protein
MAALASLEPQEVERYAQSFEALYYQGDYVTMASYYTEDAQLMNEGQEIIRGRKDIEQFWQMVCQMAGKMKRTIEIQEIVASGDIGYLRSKVTTHIQGANAQEMTAIFKDISIWKRGPDGTWQLAVDIANHDPAPTGQQDQAVC